MPVLGPVTGWLTKKRSLWLLRRFGLPLAAVVNSQHDFGRSARSHSPAANFFRGIERGLRDCGRSAT